MSRKNTLIIMRKNYFFIGMLLWSFSILGQTEKEGQLFKLKATLKADYLNKIKNVSKDKTSVIGPFFVEENVIYRVQSVNITTKKVLFYALKYSELSDGTKGKDTNSDKAYYYNDKLFEIELSDYKTYANDVEIADRFSLGILTLPFKYRPQNGASFENKFNINTVISYLLTNSLNQNTKCYFQFGAGYGAVNLNSDNARGITPGTNENIETITGFGGLMLEYKKIQTGLYFGADKVNNNSKYDWQSQGKIWLSVGIGYKIFTISKDNADKKSAQ